MRILIVEDNEMNLEIVCVILQKMGYKTLEAVNGLDGYHMALKEKPNLIILDYHLPGMNGVQLAQKIKNTDEIRHIPIIALTADIYAKQALIDAGCDVYLEKPIRSGSLLRTVNQVLAAHSA